MYRQQTWTDPFLAWDPAEFDGTPFVELSAEDIWIPQVGLLNRYISPTLSYMIFKYYADWGNVFILITTSGFNTLYVFFHSEGEYMLEQRHVMTTL